MGSLKTGLVVFGLVIGTAAMAQGRGEGKSPQERAQFRTDWMAKELSLTEAQKTKVAELNLAAVEKNQSIKADASLTAEQKKEAWRANHKEQKTKLKEILTAEQLATLKAKKEAMKSKHGEKHAERKTDKTPQQRAEMRTERLSKELSLTEAQKPKVTEVNRATIEKNDQIRNDASLTQEQKEAAFKANREAQKAQMKEILTAEQQKALKAKRKEVREKHSEKQEKK